MNESGVVIGNSEEALPSAAAGKETTAIYLIAGQIRFCLFQTDDEIFIGGMCIAQLKLDGLPGAGEGSGCNGSTFGIGADEIANQKVASPKLLLIFVEDQTEEEITLRPLFYCFRQV